MSGETRCGAEHPDERMWSTGKRCEKPAGHSGEHVYTEPFPVGSMETHWTDDGVVSGVRPASPPPAVTGEAMTHARLTECRDVMLFREDLAQPVRRVIADLLREVTRLRASGTDERLREAYLAGAREHCPAFAKYGECAACEQNAVRYAAGDVPRASLPSEREGQR